MVVCCGFTMIQGGLLRGFFGGSWWFMSCLVMVCVCDCLCHVNSPEMAPSQLKATLNPRVATPEATDTWTHRQSAPRLRGTLSRYDVANL